MKAIEAHNTALNILSASPKIININRLIKEAAERGKFSIEVSLDTYTSMLEGIWGYSFSDDPITIYLNLRGYSVKLVDGRDRGMRLDNMNVGVPRRTVVIGWLQK